MELIIHSNSMQEVECISAEYPYVLNKVTGKDTRVPWHWHEEVEFSFVRQGSLRVTIAGHSCIFKENEGFFINSNILHTMAPADPEADVLWDSHLFHPMLLGSHYRSIFDTKYMAPILKNRNCELVPFRGENETQQQILHLLQQAVIAQQSEYCEFRTRSIFSEIWLLLSQELTELQTHSQLPKPVSQERIQMMLAFIHRHYAEKLTLEQIAAAAIISTRECLRCFQNCIQKTPFEYLMDYRIQMAESLLRTTDLPVTEIALQTGFNNSAYFSKIFRQLRSLSPGQYRKLSRESEAP